MSLRKPKSVIIKHDESDSSGGGEDHNETISSSVRQVKARKKKGRAKKVTVNKGFEDEDDVEAGLPAEVKLAKRPIPLFEEYKDDVGGYMNEIREKMSKAKEYITVPVEDDAILEPEEDPLDDGMLPLTTKDAEMQRKLRDMEIKESMYDLELDFEGEADTGGTAIKMNLLPDGKDYKSELELEIQRLEMSRQERLESLEELSSKRAEWNVQLVQLANEVKLLAGE